MIGQSRKPPLLRVALRIADGITADGRRGDLHSLTRDFRHMEILWGYVCRNHERALKATRHGLGRAARETLVVGRFDRDGLATSLDRLRQSVAEYLHPPGVVINLGEVLAELQAVEEEFESTDWDQDTLWVRTDSIELGGINLGRFKIKLSLDWIGVPNPEAAYEVVALDPNPAVGDSEVTHPHVSGGHLCEGEATGPIRHALEQCRLVDFFFLVRSTLETYNPHSPHISLKDWYRVECVSCGESAREDESCSCRACESVLCDSCVESCHQCSETYCEGCISVCRECGEPSCSACLDPCSDCGKEGLCGSCRMMCIGCHQEGLCCGCCKDELCSTCIKEQAREDDDEEDEPKADIPSQMLLSADAGVHTDSVAETTVPVPCR